MKGASCILCHTKQKDWTCAEKASEAVAEAKRIYNMLADEDGYVKYTAGDFA